MLRTALHLTLAAGTIAGFSAATLAGPVNKSWVAENARWMVHVDAEALTASTLGKHVIEHRKDLGLEGLDELSTLGIDPFKDIKGITIYDTDPDDHALVIATTTAAVDMLVDMLKSDPKTKTMTVEEKTIIAFDDKGKTQYWHIRPGSNAEERIVFLSDNWQHVADGLAVVDGKKHSLAEASTATDKPAPAVLLAPAAPGAFIQIRAASLPDQIMKQQDESASAVLSQVGGVAIDAGENESDAFVRATVSADTAENAANISQFLQGVVALGKLVTGSDEELQPLAKVLAGVSISAKERDISVSLKHNAKKLGEALEKLNDHEDADDEHDGDKHDKKPAEKKS